nr:hypothetical protein [Tanacetum cinerariifolium]
QGFWGCSGEWLWETWVDRGVVKVAGKGSCRRGRKLVNSEQYFECRGDRVENADNSGKFKLLDKLPNKLQIQNQTLNWTPRIAKKVCFFTIRVKGSRPMGIEDIASWDLDNSTWGGWGEVVGTVPV